MIAWLNLVVGGIAGTLARYVLAGAVYQVLGAAFPYGTLVVNVTGCFAIGFFSGLAEERFLLGPHARLLLMTGFCGAFTTFSTLILETANLLKSGETLRAWINIAASLGAGLMVFWLGIVVAERL